ncbi:hypothetical protein BN1080_00959 [Planococcus massiliensis]|uniref:DUF7713 domain-containing protein n=1 Tax=Planococcus massiliensis TaxID=1499687 RepID=A0A098EIB2_9BACL|nr:hypothetical protein [Planococcus massiliensis]CEG22039.1 hypothetical protein BN1080_00959 [Planococcus massiliensis]
MGDDVPLVVIDGTTYTWEEVGKMLMHYEGFQLKLEMVDSYDEIGWEDEGVGSFLDLGEEK